MSRYLDTRTGTPLHSLTTRGLERMEAAGFERDFARSRHNADYPGCSECQGRRACDYCGHGTSLTAPLDQPSDSEANT